NGVALSVECDAKPAEIRRKLEAILGPATVVVASGGVWRDEATGTVEDKLHLHWRLPPTPSPGRAMKLGLRGGASTGEAGRLRARHRRPAGGTEKVAQSAPSAPLGAQADIPPGGLPRRRGGVSHGNRRNPETARTLK